MSEIDKLERWLIGQCEENKIALARNRDKEDYTNCMQLQCIDKAYNDVLFRIQTLKNTRK